MPEQLRDARWFPSWMGWQRTHGNVGRAVCLRATVQRLNVINTNRVRPLVLNIRQRELLARNVGGKHYDDSLMELTASPLGGALVGGKGTHNDTD